MRPVLLHPATPDVSIRIDLERLFPMPSGVLKIGRLPRGRVVALAVCAAEPKLRQAVAWFELRGALVRPDDVIPRLLAGRYAERVAVRTPRRGTPARRGGS
jgi:hypothetical protein